MTLLNYPNPNNVPNNIKNQILKYGYTYVIQEAMRLLHNQIGKWHKGGLTQTQYDNLPQYIKDLKPYTPQLTLEEFNWFIDNWWNPRDRTVMNDTLEMREVIKGFIIDFASYIDLENIPHGS